RSAGLRRGRRRRCKPPAGDRREASIQNAKGSRWATPLAGVVSGLLFALAFPPVGWAILLPLALTPWLVALRREESAARALWSGFALGLAYWCASIPWIVYVVTHYGGQRPALRGVSLASPAR